ncbi:MAG TPA: hypothetical protein VMU92_12515 [Acidobacteriaceae bacterium]|nr:hypothetical protein [Acidobacteriaceae bacterium]
MSVILLVAVIIHLPLMLMELPLKSYDTNFHIFFASHYLHHWFNPWNAKWFAGFSQTTYPPLAQQWVAVMSIPLGLNLGYMAVQLAAILLLAVGVYRFSLLWVSPRAASYAALASVFIGAESFLVYSAGQLATTAAAPVYLNALPYLYYWLRSGRWKSFLKAVVLFAAAAAVHHATFIFGSLFFALPLVVLALMDRAKEVRNTAASVLVRTLVAVVVINAAVAVVLLPFWIGLIHYPVTQTPIPHPSRASYILSPHWAVNYFLVPWGAMILALPFIILRGSKVARLRPLMLSFWLVFLIGLGGTTPVGYWLLGRAFDVLTFERFSYWATLLALPILGALIADLIQRFRMRAAVPIALLAAFTCAFAVSWSHYRPANNLHFSVKTVANWLNRDGHDRYRYVTLGFGNKLSQLALLTDASSVDGGSNSARMLPELTRYGGGALTDAKYFGEGGLNSLRAMLRHANRYGLKWVLVADPYYDPLLDFAGWRQVDQLDENAITVWSKDGVPPATPVNTAHKPPRWQGVMWGALPFGSGLLAILVVFIPEERRRSGDGDDGDEQEAMASGMAS